MTDQELINELANKVNRGEITFDKVRPILEEKGFDEQRIRVLVRSIDDEVQKAMLKGSESSYVERLIPLGIVLIVIGAVMALGSLAGFFSLSSQLSVIVTYGSLVAGIVLVVAGIRRKRTKDPNADSKTLNRSFRLRRDKDDE